MLVAMYKTGKRASTKRRTGGGVPKRACQNPPYPSGGTVACVRVRTSKRASFLTLREVPGAQWEICQYAERFTTILRENPDERSRFMRREK